MKIIQDISVPEAGHSGSLFDSPNTLISPAHPVHGKAKSFGCIGIIGLTAKNGFIHSDTVIIVTAHELGESLQPQRFGIVRFKLKKAVAIDRCLLAPIFTNLLLCLLKDISGIGHLPQRFFCLFHTDIIRAVLIFRPEAVVHGKSGIGTSSKTFAAIITFAAIPGKLLFFHLPPPRASILTVPDISQPSLPYISFDF
jgi:hypothetical protein